MADPKPSTSQDQPQDESISEQQPQDESISEQQPQDESVSEQQPQDESISEQPQGVSASEQPQGKASTSTLQETVPSQFSDNDETLPDAWTMARKTFATKDPRSIPKKPRYSLQLKKQIIFNPFFLIFSLQIKRKTSYILENSRIVTKCQVHQNFSNLPLTSHILA